MALTVGILRYDGSRGHRLGDLTGTPEFAGVFTEFFPETNADDRLRALQKLDRWVSHSAIGYIPHLRKGQDKSFAGMRQLMTWLRYQTGKQFVANAQKEKQLAEMINDCPGIRQTVARITTHDIQAYWDRLSPEVKIQNSDLEGRYARFYSNIIWRNRRLGDGIAYFRNKRNPSLSEMAAFLADFALRHTLTPVPTRTRGHELLRYNRVKTQHDVTEALRALATGAANLAATLPQAQQNITELTTLTRLLGDNIPFNEFMANATLRDLFNRFKTEHRNHNEPDERIYTSDDFQMVIEENREPVRREKNSLIRSYNAATASLTENARDTQRQIATAKATKSNRLNFNVDPEHDWTAFMMARSQMIGAGPSSTTAATLELVRLIIPADQNDQKAYYSVAMALFAFWRRKKTLLRGSSAVHTWNEVVTALENYLDEGSEFIFPMDQAFVPDDPAMQRRVYECPERFTERGYPMFANHNP